jgi:hypothetical protein
MWQKAKKLYNKFYYQIFAFFLDIILWFAYQSSIHYNGFDMLRPLKLIWFCVITLYLIVFVILEILNFIFEKQEKEEE